MPGLKMAEVVVDNEVISDIDLVVFDKDGTLIDLHYYWYTMVSYRAKMICEYLGLTKKDFENLMEVMGINTKQKRVKPEGPVGQKKREIVMMAAVDYLRSTGFPGQFKLCREVFARVDKSSVSNLKDIVRPIEGLFSIFDAIKRTSCQIAIATSDITNRVWLVMNHLGLKDKVDVVVGSDRVAREKPHPETIEMILKELQVSSENAIMVGDACADLEMGISAGMRASIGVTSGVSSKKDLLAITSYVIPNISFISINS
jgi:phosphoglycolate phosphatase